MPVSQNHPTFPAGTGDDCFRLAMAASGIGMALVDLDGRWREVNPAIERMLGRDAAALVGQPVLDCIHPEDRALTQDGIDGLASGRLPVVDNRKRYLRAGGEPLWVHTNAALMRGDDGAPMFLVVQLRDVTAEHQAQAVLQAAAHDRAAALDASTRQLQLFADAVAHDLRAPLRSIENFSRLLATRAGDSLDATGRDHLDRIRGAAARMSSLLSALAELSHVTGAELKPGRVDISLLAEWVLAELQDADPARAVELEVQPGLYAHGDERLLKLLLGQLLDNAWKFSRDADTVRISVTGRTAGDVLELTLRDAGSGFDMRYAHKLFEPFQRLHGPDEGGGHGLGLAIAARVAERHGGRLHAESEPGKGATFHLELPAAPPDAPAAEEHR
ncbi:sensor histidine kinase [Novilysobacter arseniciresistens]|uniref:sensor histidine kinase n=1 Tax=Novilysobacter arseniciresistens TaxID=1385522 RepID=UPI001362C353|nr:ATP-binding protein [Lysobacter arseniciresistens]